MKLITRQTRAKEAAKRWKLQFGGKKFPVYHKLLHLGVDPDPNDVDEIIGNKSWTTVPICSECGVSDANAIVEIGEEYTHESETAFLCEGCIKQAYELVGKVKFDLVSHLYRQKDWSERTFGPGLMTKGITDHIRKELKEIEDEPCDLAEWIDVVILALDGAWRAGFEPEEIVKGISDKQSKNEKRSWPDWRNFNQDIAIEHIRSTAANGHEDTIVPAPAPHKRPPGEVK